MRFTKSVPLSAIVIAVGCAVAAAVLFWPAPRPTPVQTPPVFRQPRPTATPAAAAATKPAEPEAVVSDEPPPQWRPTAPPPPPPARQGAPPPVVRIAEPLARQALSLVGVDPWAEEIWMQAINDPNMSAHDRSNLIEDLNETGFADPDNLTGDDLPMIVNRIQLIEQIANDAMDDVNYAAFEEAYKDLVNMYYRVVGR